MRFSRPTRRWAVVAAAGAAVVGLIVAFTVGSGPAAKPRAGGPLAGRSLAPIPAPLPGGGKRANVVFVLTDDLSSDLLRYMPHVQALAERGTSFSNYFVVDSLCCPSRAAILTGLYPHDTHVFYNSGPQGGWNQFMRVGDGRKVFGVSLQQAGYRTGIMGKYLNRYPPSAAPPPGWNEWDVTGSQGYNELDYNLNVNGRVRHYGHAARDYLTDVLAGRAERFVGAATHEGRPFALEIATYAPHAPSVPAPADRGTFAALQAPRGPAWNRLPAHAPRWLAPYPRLTRPQIADIDAKYRRRVESVQAVDRMVGELELQLSRLGQLGNTYFVFSSDNGFHMGQRRMLPGKQTAYDSDIRVPLIVAGPGVPAGRTDPAIVSSIDLAPTFEQIAGARPTFAHDGTSMLARWRGQPPPAGWSKVVLIEHRASYDTGDPDRQPSRSGMGPSYEAVRTADFLYVEYVTGDREYYDLHTDPGELNNVVGQLAPTRIDRLHQLLTGLAGCHGVTCRTLAAG